MRQASMQARTQSPWQEGAQVARPQHSKEQLRCWAGEAHASCARAASAAPTITAHAVATVRNAFQHFDIKVTPGSPPAPGPWRAYPLMAARTSLRHVHGMTQKAG
jgi:hypothetical protein